MFEKYFFDIPVYRYTLEKYFAEKTELKNKSKEYSLRTYSVCSPLLNKETEVLIDKLTQDYFIKNERSWEFTQTVAYIRLFTCGNQIRGEDYWVRERITKRMRSRTFDINGKVFEINIDKDWDNIKIYSEILDELEKLKDNEKYMKRFIDLDQFKTIGEFVDWRKLISL